VFPGSTILRNIANINITDMPKKGIVILLMLPLICFAGFAQTQADGRILCRNLALSSEVTVSSTGEKGLYGENAADGDTLTRWGSAGKLLLHRTILLTYQRTEINGRISLRKKTGMGKPMSFCCLPFRPATYG
jgi:hypothetical protein